MGMNTSQGIGWFVCGGSDIVVEGVGSCRVPRHWI